MSLSLSLRDILGLTGGDSNSPDLDTPKFSALSTLKRASHNSISFLVKDQANLQLNKTKAGCVLVPDSFKGVFQREMALVYVDHPYHQMCRLATKYLPRILNTNEDSTVHSLAKIHPTAVVEGQVLEGAEIGAFVHIMKGASVGAGSRVDSGCVLYPGAHIAKQCHIHSGVVLGARGFGFYEYLGHKHKVAHWGGVQIGEGCEIGANAVIAAGFLEATELGAGCHLDSFVQIGHNCSLGCSVYMASQSGVAGGTEIGDGVEIGGGAQIAGHLSIGSGARIAAKSGVTKSVPDHQTWAGFPAQPIADWRRQVIKSRIK
jgi:UDP-3-O-[3-hydroxymyristoyl] glucosamine N-acyltransferase